MFKRIAGVALACSAFIGAGDLTAQDDVGAETPGTGQGFFMIGWQKLDLDELNERLIAAGFPSMSEDFLSLGGGGWWMGDRFLIGGEGHALLGSDETTSGGGFKTRIEGGYGQLDLGFPVYRGDRLDVAPILGIGGGSVSVDLLERGSPLFDDVLTDPRTGARLTAEGFNLDLSVAVTWRLTRSVDDDGDEGGFAVGLRGGYAYSLGDWEWKLNDDTEVPGGPQLGTRGVYLRLMLGGWGRGSDGN
jgi:hypothetical protein